MTINIYIIQGSLYQSMKDVDRWKSQAFLIRNKINIKGQPEI